MRSPAKVTRFYTHKVSKVMPGWLFTMGDPAMSFIRPVWAPLGWKS